MWLGNFHWPFTFSATIMAPRLSLETNSSVSVTHSPEIFDKSLSSGSSPGTEPSEQGSLEDKFQEVVGEKNIIIHCDQRFSGLPPHTLVAGKSNPDDLDMPDRIYSDDPPLVYYNECITNENKQAFHDAQFLLEVSREWGLHPYQSEFGH